MASSNLLAGLDVVVYLAVLDGGAHDGRLPNPALHLPLGGQVDDHRQVDDGHGAQHRQGLAQAQGPAYRPETDRSPRFPPLHTPLSPVALDFGLLLLVFVLVTAPAHPVLRPHTASHHSTII